jgi:hypothetical protein
VSKTKAVGVLGRHVWAWDNSHDIALAHMIRAAERDEIDDATLTNWKVWATVGDLALQIEESSNPNVSTILRLVARARAAIEEHGDVVRTDLERWSVLDGKPISGGVLRVDPLPVAAVLDFVSGLEAMLNGELEPDPHSSWWMLGAPDGRTAVRMRIQY